MNKNIDYETGRDLNYSENHPANTPQACLARLNKIMERKNRDKKKRKEHLFYNPSLSSSDLKNSWEALGFREQEHFLETNGKGVISWINKLASNIADGNLGHEAAVEKIHIAFRKYGNWQYRDELSILLASMAQKPEFEALCDQYLQHAASVFFIYCLRNNKMNDERWKRLILNRTRLSKIVDVKTISTLIETFCKENKNVLEDFDRLGIDPISAYSN